MEFRGVLFLHYVRSQRTPITTNVPEEHEAQHLYPHLTQMRTQSNEEIGLLGSLSHSLSCQRRRLAFCTPAYMWNGASLRKL